MHTKRILSLSLLRDVYIYIYIYIYENLQIVQKIVHYEGYNLAYGDRLQDSFQELLQQARNIKHYQTTTLTKTKYNGVFA